MQDAPIPDNDSGRGLFDRTGKGLDDGFKGSPAPGSRTHLAIGLHQENSQLLGGEDVLAAVQDLLEHRRGVGHRTADDVQYIGCRRLLR